MAYIKNVCPVQKSLVKINPWLVLAEQWRGMFTFITRIISRNPSILLMRLMIDNNADILAITWKPLPLKHRRKVFHLANCLHFVWWKKYLQNKKVSKIGKLIFQNKDGATLSQQHIPLQVASAIFEGGKMSKHIYTDICFCQRVLVLMFFLLMTGLTNLERIANQKWRNCKIHSKEGNLIMCHVSNLQQVNWSDHLNYLLFMNWMKFTYHYIMVLMEMVVKGSTETNNIIMYMFHIENLKKPNGEIMHPLHLAIWSCCCWERNLEIIANKKARTLNLVQKILGWP